MPEIIPNQSFKHGRETYEKGKTYDVSEGEAYYFEQCGWVGGETNPPSGETVTLDVQDSHLGHTSEIK